MAFVYKIIIYNDSGNIENFYVGQTTRTIKERMNEHLRSKKPTTLEVMMQSHEWECRVYCECRDEDIKRMERYFIRELKANCRRFPDSRGLNTTDGGELSSILGYCQECGQEIRKTDVYNDNGYYYECPNPDCRRILSYHRYVNKRTLYEQLNTRQDLVHTFQYAMLSSENTNFDRQHYIDELFGWFDERDRYHSEH